MSMIPKDPGLDVNDVLALFLGDSSDGAMPSDGGETGAGQAPFGLSDFGASALDLSAVTEATFEEQIDQVFFESEELDDVIPGGAQGRWHRGKLRAEGRGDELPKGFRNRWEYEKFKAEYTGSSGPFGFDVDTDIPGPDQAYLGIQEGSRGFWQAFDDLTYGTGELTGVLDPESSYMQAVQDESDIRNLAQSLAISQHADGGLLYTLGNMSGLVGSVFMGGPAAVGALIMGGQAYSGGLTAYDLDILAGKGEYSEGRRTAAGIASGVFEFVPSLIGLGKIEKLVGGMSRKSGISFARKWLTIGAGSSFIEFLEEGSTSVLQSAFGPLIADTEYGTLEEALDDAWHSALMGAAAGGILGVAFNARSKAAQSDLKYLVGQREIGGVDGTRDQAAKAWGANHTTYQAVLDTPADRRAEVAEGFVQNNKDAQASMDESAGRWHAAMGLQDSSGTSAGQLYARASFELSNAVSDMASAEIAKDDAALASARTRARAAMDSMEANSSVGNNESWLAAKEALSDKSVSAGFRPVIAAQNQYDNTRDGEQGADTMHPERIGQEVLKAAILFDAAQSVAIETAASANAAKSALIEGGVGWTKPPTPLEVVGEMDGVELASDGASVSETGESSGNLSNVDVEAGRVVRGFGLEPVFVDGGSAPAFWNAKTPGKIYIRRNSNLSLGKLLGKVMHEAAHLLKYSDPKAYAMIREILGGSSIVDAAERYIKAAPDEQTASQKFLDREASNLITAIRSGNAPSDMATIGQTAAAEYIETEGVAVALESGDIQKALNAGFLGRLWASLTGVGERGRATYAAMKLAQLMRDSAGKGGTKAWTPTTSQESLALFRDLERMGEAQAATERVQRAVSVRRTTPKPDADAKPKPEPKDEKAAKSAAERVLEAAVSDEEDIEGVQPSAAPEPDTGPPTTLKSRMDGPIAKFIGSEEGVATQVELTEKTGAGTLKVSHLLKAVAASGDKEAPLASAILANVDDEKDRGIGVRLVDDISASGGAEGVFIPRSSVHLAFPQKGIVGNKTQAFDRGILELTTDSRSSLVLHEVAHALTVSEIASSIEKTGLPFDTRSINPSLRALDSWLTGDVTKGGTTLTTVGVNEDVGKGYVNKLRDLANPNIFPEVSPDVRGLIQSYLTVLDSPTYKDASQNNHIPYHHTWDNRSEELRDDDLIDRIYSMQFRGHDVSDNGRRMTMVGRFPLDSNDPMGAGRAYMIGNAPNSVMRLDVVRHRGDEDYEAGTWLLSAQVAGKGVTVIDSFSPELNIDEVLRLVQSKHPQLRTPSMLDGVSAGVYTEEQPGFANRPMHPAGVLDADGNTVPYGLSNIEEFVAEALSNTEFQSMLQGFPSAKGKVDLLSKIIAAVRNILGIDPKSPNATLLTDVLTDTQSLISRSELETGEVAWGTKPMTISTLYSREADLSIGPEFGPEFGLPKSARSIELETGSMLDVVGEVFTSRAQLAIVEMPEEKKDSITTPQKLLDYLRTERGVTKDELYWTGLSEYLTDIAPGESKELSPVQWMMVEALAKPMPVTTHAGLDPHWRDQPVGKQTPEEYTPRLGPRATATASQMHGGVQTTENLLGVGQTIADALVSEVLLTPQVLVEQMLGGETEGVGDVPALGMARFSFTTDQSGGAGGQLKGIVHNVTGVLVGGRVVSPSDLLRGDVKATGLAMGDMGAPVLIEAEFNGQVGLYGISTQYDTASGSRPGDLGIRLVRLDGDPRDQPDSLDPKGRGPLGEYNVEAVSNAIDQWLSLRTPPDIPLVRWGDEVWVHDQAAMKDAPQPETDLTSNWESLPVEGVDESRVFFGYKSNTIYLSKEDADAPFMHIPGLRRSKARAPDVFPPGANRGTVANLTLVVEGVSPGVGITTGSRAQTHVSMFGIQSPYGVVQTMLGWVRSLIQPGPNGDYLYVGEVQGDYWVAIQRASQKAADRERGHTVFIALRDALKGRWEEIFPGKPLPGVLSAEHPLWYDPEASTYSKGRLISEVYGQVADGKEGEFWGNVAEEQLNRFATSVDGPRVHPSDYRNIEVALMQWIQVSTNQTDAPWLQPLAKAVKKANKRIMGRGTLTAKQRRKLRRAEKIGIHAVSDLLEEDASIAVRLGGAPFSSTEKGRFTYAWEKLLLKRALAWAVQSGLRGIALPNGTLLKTAVSEHGEGGGINPERADEIYDRLASTLNKIMLEVIGAHELYPALRKLLADPVDQLIKKGEVVPITTPTIQPIVGEAKPVKTTQVTTTGQLSTDIQGWLKGRGRSGGVRMQNTAAVQRLLEMLGGFPADTPVFNTRGSSKEDFVRMDELARKGLAVFWNSSEELYRASSQMEPLVGIGVLPSIMDTVIGSPQSAFERHADWYEDLVEERDAEDFGFESGYDGDEHRRHAEAYWMEDRAYHYGEMDYGDWLETGEAESARETVVDGLIESAMEELSDPITVDEAIAEEHDLTVGDEVVEYDGEYFATDELWLVEEKIKEELDESDVDEGVLEAYEYQEPTVVFDSDGDIIDGPFDGTSAAEDAVDRLNNEAIDDLVDNYDPSFVNYDVAGVENDNLGMVRFVDFGGDGSSIRNAVTSQINSGHFFLHSRDTRTATPQFRAKFSGSVVVNADGSPQQVYHGTSAADRYSGGIQKDRATSGPMPFFTDDPDIASGYTEKRDTSLDYEDLTYENWFKVAGSPVTTVWHRMTQEERAAAEDMFYSVGQDEDTGEIREGIGSIASNSHLEWTIKENRGNVVAAAVDLWLNSGSLYNNEVEFKKVLDHILPGRINKTVQYRDPHAQVAGIVPAYLVIKNPLVVEDGIPQELMTALEEESVTGAAQPKYPEGTDMWDKDARDPEVWMEALKENPEHAFTSIPDWVTETLKKFGYDGIKDLSGKYDKEGKKKSNVWIPFETEQVLPVLTNRGQWSLMSRQLQPTSTEGVGSELAVPVGMWRQGGRIIDRKLAYQIARSLVDRSKRKGINPTVAAAMRAEAASLRTEAQQARQDHSRLREQKRLEQNASNTGYRAGAAATRERLQVTINELKLANKEQVASIRDLARVRLAARRALKSLPGALYRDFITDVIKAKTNEDILEISTKVARRSLEWEATQVRKDVGKVKKRMRKRGMRNETRASVDEMLTVAGELLSIDTPTGNRFNASLSTEEMAQRANRVKDLLRAVMDVYTVDRNEFKSQRMERLIQVAADRAEVAANIRSGSWRDKKRIKDLGITDDPNALSVLWQESLDADNLFGSLEGNDPILLRAWNAMRSAKGRVWRAKRTIDEKVDDAIARAGYKSREDFLSRTTPIMGEGAMERVTVRLGGKRVNITLGSALGLAAIDTETFNSLPTESDPTAVSGGITFRESPSRAPIQVTQGEVVELRKTLGAKKMRLVQDLKDILESDIRDDAMRVYWEEKGGEPPLVENYWPRARSQEDFAKDIVSGDMWTASDAIGGMLDNIPSMKARTGGVAALQIGSLFSVFDQHVDSTLQLIHMSRPLRNFDAIIQDRDVRDAIASRMGDKAILRIREMLAYGVGLSGRNVSGGVISAVQSNIARAVLPWNVRTWFRMLGGSFRIADRMPLLSWSSGIASVSNFTPVVRGRMVQRIEDYNGYFYDRHRRSQVGRYTNLIKDPAARRQLVLSFKSAARALRQIGADEEASIWDKAVATLGTGKDLTKNLLAFLGGFDHVLRAIDRQIMLFAVNGYMSSGLSFEASVDAAEMAFRQTQNVSDPLDDTMFASRVKGAQGGKQFAKVMLMFSSDPLKAYNQLRGAVRGIDGLSDTEGMAKAGKTLFAVTSNVAWSMAASPVFVAGSLAVGMLFDDEDDEDLRVDRAIGKEILNEKELAKIKRKAVEEFAAQTGGVVGWFISQAVYAAQQGFSGSWFGGDSLEVSALDELNDFFSTVYNIAGDAWSEEEEVDPADVLKALLKAAQLLGLPLESISKTAESARRAAAAPEEDVVWKHLNKLWETGEAMTDQQMARWKEIKAKRSAASKAKAKQTRDLKDLARQLLSTQ